ncbi:helix-turn-helix domain-containing protein [Staphylococcus simulans]
MDYSYNVFQGWSCIKDNSKSEEYVNVYLVLSGEAIVKKRAQLFIYKSGDIFVQQPHFTPMEVEIKEGTVVCLSIHAVYFKPACLKEINDVESNFEIHHIIKNDYIQALRFVCETNFVKANTMIIRMAKYLRVYLENFDVYVFNMTNNPMINHIIEYINHHPDESLKLTTIAESFDLNISYLSRVFKDVVHINYNEYIQQVKIFDVAEYLLLNGEDSQKRNDIWKNYEYSSKRAFLNSFKKYFHMMPMDYVVQSQQRRVKNNERSQQVYDEVLKFVND